MPPKWTANPVRAKRYRPGKGEDAPSEDESSDDEEQERVEAPPPRKPAPSARSFPKTTAPAKAVAAVHISEQPVINEDEFVTESEGEGDGIKAPKAAREETAGGLKSESEAESGEEEAESGSEEEEESESEDEAPAKLLRPTFIRKDQRGATATATSTSTSASAATYTAAAIMPAALLAASSTSNTADEAARRRAAADQLVVEQLEKRAAARAAGRKEWDDDEGNLAEDEVDDTDGIDPEAERAAWKLRELKRVKRTRDAIEAAEKEREEVERRRGLTQEEREREDREHIERQKEEKAGSAGAGYMRKYFHKGAFYQDDEVAEELRKRDVMGAKFADETNREVLPQYMQIRDMTKLGKKGRTRYKDLRSEDTGAWGQSLAGPKRERWMGDERFAPDRDVARGSGPDRSGANAAPVGQRQPRIPRSRSRSPRQERRRSRSREHRKRSRSPAYSDRSEDEKRRRVGNE